MPGRLRNVSWTLRRGRSRRLVEMAARRPGKAPECESAGSAWRVRGVRCDYGCALRQPEHRIHRRVAFGNLRVAKWRLGRMTCGAIVVQVRCTDRACTEHVNAVEESRMQWW